MLCSMRRGLGAHASSILEQMCLKCLASCVRREAFFDLQITSMFDVCQSFWLTHADIHLTNAHFNVCLMCVFAVSRLLSVADWPVDSPWCLGSSAANHWPSAAADAKGGWCAWQKPLPMGALRMAGWRVLMLRSFQQVFYEFLWYW